MLHETVKDAAGTIGEVMGHVGGYYQLRPIGGGKERDVPESQIRMCSPEEALKHKLAVANARSSGKCLSSDW
jgi:hypothetical protein